MEDQQTPQTAEGEANVVTLCGSTKFEAEFADRFRGGELVEHTGWVDTEGLLRQLGHHREG